VRSKRALAATVGISAAVAACESGGYTSLGSNAEPSDALPETVPGHSGLPWPSGTNVGDLAALRAWAAFRGRPNDVALVLTDYTSWDGITRPTILDPMQSYEGVLVIAQPFWPDRSGGSLSACAAGDYDANWRTFGATLAAKGRQASIVRLAWQFNGNDVEWSATDPVPWVDCFRRVVTAIRVNAPEARIDWSMNAHGTDEPQGGDTFDVYPGDDFVDVIGIDAYDMTPSSPDEASFTEQCRGPEGICTVADFARRHGKRLGVGQWAVVTCNGFGDRGDDNAFYVERMHRLFQENADIMGYETYYNDRKTRSFCTSLLDPVEAPTASARYQQLWGP
jgi:hypothetical protein